MNANHTMLDATLERLRESWLKERPTYQQRMDDLARLRALLRARINDMAEAISADFGNRSRHETLLAEASTVFAEIDHARHNLKRWMKPVARKAGWKQWPARAEIRPVPLGVIGIISPWNYPVNLALAPLVAAIAAGNHVFLKPSEHTPRTSEFLKQLLTDVFPQTRVAAAEGDAALSAQFAALPFDHLFFTGSTAVGRKVMAAAAPNLTPVTLELGGKSPAIITAEADLNRAARAIANGKFFNAGQTCIAPDYILIHHEKCDRFIAFLKDEMKKRYIDSANLADQTTLINDAAHRRLVHLLADVEKRCEAIIPLLDAPAANAHPRLMTPTLILEPEPTAEIMREEIFGPLLPIISYTHLNEALDFVETRDRPLALYCFSENKTEIETILARIVAGGVCINDTLYQFAVTDLPFGGIGPSGMGQYHGHEGFLTFSKQMPILTKYKPAPSDMIKPPFKGLTNWLIRFLAR